MINILIVDDRELLRESFKIIIQQPGFINVVACASNGEEAVRACEVHKPNVVLMDIRMDLCDGIEAAKSIKSRFGNRIKILFLSEYEDERNICNAIKSGADGYVSKDVEPNVLRKAIEIISLGLKVYNAKANSLFPKLVQIKDNSTNDRNEQIDTLSSKEKQIVYLISQGKTNKEIADAVYLSVGTIKNIVSKLISKFDVNNRSQLGNLLIKKV